MRNGRIRKGLHRVTDGDIEHPVVLPAQPREHARVLRGTVRRVTRPWAGLAVVVQDLAGGSLQPLGLSDEKSKGKE